MKDVKDEISAFYMSKNITTIHDLCRFNRLDEC